MTDGTIEGGYLVAYLSARPFSEPIVQVGIGKRHGLSSRLSEAVAFGEILLGLAQETQR